MRKIVLLTLLMLVVASLASLSAAAAAIPSSQSRGGSTELSKVRWANHTEALTGTAMLRMVMDVSGPVEASGVVINEPTPRLVVTIKGTTLGKQVEDLTFDGKVVDKVRFDTSGKDTKIFVDLPLKVQPSDYKVFTLPKDVKANKPYRVVVDINKPLSPPDFSFTPGLKDKVITIDPGHGGSDPGAIGPSGYQEKTATLAVAQNVKNLLEKAGATVVMTREDDRDVFGPNASDVDELKARSTVANNRKTDIFVSIHCDSFSDRSAGGTTTYYYQKTLYDSMLADAVQTSLVDAGNLLDRGAKQANFYVIKRTSMPAVLVEMAFISNPNEEKLLSSPDFQKKMSLGIVRGLERFFSQAARLN